MSALPAYEPSPTAGSPLPGEDAGPSTYAGSCYGGGGVRLPCSYREKVDLDNLLIKSLSANKTPITWESFEVGRRTVSVLLS